MSEVIDKKPIATVALATKEVVSNNYSEKIEKFITALLALGM